MLPPPSRSTSGTARRCPAGLPPKTSPRRSTGRALRRPCPGPDGAYPAPLALRGARNAGGRTAQRRTRPPAGPRPGATPARRPRARASGAGASAVHSQDARGEPGAKQGDQAGHAHHAEGEKRRAPQEGAGGGARQALEVGGDPGRQVLQLKARQHDGDDERRDAQSLGGRPRHRRRTAPRRRPRSPPRQPTATGRPAMTSALSRRGPARYAFT
jgi:hypothetical protein